MKRTGEMVLGVIGVGMDALFMLLGIVVLIIMNSGVGLLEQGINELGYGGFNQFLYLFINLIWIPIVSCVISFVLGIIGLLNLSKKPNVAGAFFIAATVVSSWLIFTGIAFQSLLYLIAGIMCFVRKPDRPSVSL
ncbi:MULTISPECIES: DUF4064 domain-containing protein [unclassified Virgibacillus]|uniref:DUF4064 domain-containing protein n=1 Tax=unclassified Virgibacillus TaxID=2620237 RepID=UPI0024DF00B9|nr:DUF4064 domain-containing protein [Virgibacillus sp. LDC-1]